MVKTSHKKKLSSENVSKKAFESVNIEEANLIVSMSTEMASYLSRNLRTLEDTMDAVFVFPEANSGEKSKAPAEKAAPIAKVKAHKVVLAACSPVFRAMFFGEIKEEAEVIVEDVRMPVFEKLINFMYNVPLEFGSMVEAVEIFMAADKYNVPMVDSIVETYLCSILTVTNCCEVYDLIYHYDVLKTKKQCIELFETKTKEVIESPGFLNSFPTTLDAIFSLEKLTGVTELNMYFALEKWLTAQDEDIDNARKSLHNIRFLSIGAADICKLKLLSLEERIAFIHRVLCPGSNEFPVPTGFSLEMQGRYKPCSKPSNCTYCSRALNSNRYCSSCGRQY